MILLLTISSLKNLFAEKVSPFDMLEIVVEADRLDLDEIYKFYRRGLYFKSLELLSKLEENINKRKNRQQLIGLIHYWKGLSYKRLNEFPEAIKNFNLAKKRGYNPKDLNYELGQSYFAQEKIQLAREEFKASFERKFKRAVSLYYVAYLTRELGDTERSFDFYKLIGDLSEKERREVEQATEFQLGDIYYQEALKRPDILDAIENYVIPQYEKARRIDENSELGRIIDDKILSLQKKYELRLFELRNGRFVISPPYFLKFAIEGGFDTNVTFSPAQTTIDQANRQSPYLRSQLLGRYTFYYKDFFAVTPEVRYALTKYLNEVPEVMTNDNTYFSAALKTAYEHEGRRFPRTTLIDFEFNESQRDIDANRKLSFNSKAHVYSLGQKIKYFSFGDSLFQLRLRSLTSYLDNSDSTTLSVSFEQALNIFNNTLLFYMGHDRMRVQNSSFDNNSSTLRLDFIFSQFSYLFTPMVSLMMTRTNPINDVESRGKETLINPSIRLTKKISNKWELQIKYDFQDYQSKDQQNFAYKKSQYAIEFGYLF